MSIDVLCIGHAAYDITMYLPEYPVENSKSETGEMLESGGGPAANAAYLLTMWGVKCAIATLVGDDRYGRMVREEFEAAGTDTSLTELRPGHVTPVSMIVVNTATGTRTVVNRCDASQQLSIEPGQLSGLDPKVLLFDGHQLQASLEALQAFPKAVSILDAGSLRPGTEVLAGRVDCLAASERFALQMTGLPDLGTEQNRRLCLERLLEINGNTAVVTLGERGLIYCTGDTFGEMAAFEVTAVDTTAAGDVFHGALAYAFLKEMALEPALRLASAAAGLSVTKRGGRASIPSLDDSLKLAGL